MSAGVPSSKERSIRAAAEASERGSQQCFRCAGIRMWESRYCQQCFDTLLEQRDRQEAAMLERTLVEMARAKANLAAIDAERTQKDACLLGRCGRCYLEERW